MPRPAPTHTNIFDLYAGSYLNAKGNVQKIKKAGWIAEHWSAALRSAALRSGAPSGRSAVGAPLRIVARSATRSAAPENGRSAGALVALRLALRDT